MKYPAPSKSVDDADANASVRLTRAWRFLGWVWIAAVIVLSLSPPLPEAPVEQGDKLGHLAAYALLMLWFAHLAPGRADRIRHALGFVALGIALEFAQGMTGYRMFDVADMAANTTGVVIGWLIAPPRGFDLLGALERRLTSAPRSG